jgi:Uma2 family endonuclease
MGETDLHRDDMVDVIETLKDRFADDPMVYVSGNLLLFYEEGNKRKHVSPDVLVAIGIPKLPVRDYYLLWREGKSPDVVIEITSKTTRREDQTKKWTLYRDVLKIPEYFQFDPTEDYLKPSLQGHRLVAGDYVPIESAAGRLPSEVLGLHLERSGFELRLYDPATQTVLSTRAEAVAAAKTARLLAEAARLQAEAAHRQELAARQQVEAENKRLRQELEDLRRRFGQ